MLKRRRLGAGALCEDIQQPTSLRSGLRSTAARAAATAASHSSPNASASNSYGKLTAPLLPAAKPKRGRRRQILILWINARMKACCNVNLPNAAAVGGLHLSNP